MVRANVTVQIAVRQTLGRRILNELPVEKVDIDRTVSAEVRREMEAQWRSRGEMALKNIILSGDTRDILRQVVTAIGWRKPALPKHLV